MRGFKAQFRTWASVFGRRFTCRRVLRRLAGGLQGHCERIGVAVSAQRVLITFVGATMQWRSPVRPIPSCSML